MNAAAAGFVDSAGENFTQCLIYGISTFRIISESESKNVLEIMDTFYLILVELAGFVIYK